MALSVAYWINPYGQILELPVVNHITALVKEPEKFDLTKDYVEQLYAKFGEPVGIEGKARNQLIREVVANGFIRIRLYPQFWSTTVNRLDSKTKKALSNWAEVARENKQAGKYHPVKILELANDNQSSFVINDIYCEFMESDTGTLEWVNTLSEFVVFKPINNPAA
ncbi:MAG: hypothetical protein ACNYZG_10355 [Gammaproteobacteria bacterium]